MIVEFTCVVCGKQVRKKRSPANMLTTPKYCSQRCAGTDRKGKGTGRAANTEYDCVVCGKHIKAYRSPSNKTAYTPKYCSVACIGTAQKGEHNPAYTGGRIVRKDGYVWLLNPDHPFADMRGYVLEHRIMMEQHIGRHLTTKEVIHHINENCSDNRIENLQLFSDQRAHMRHHAAQKEAQA